MTIILGVECKTQQLTTPNYYSGRNDPSIIVVSADDLRVVFEKLEARIAELEAQMKTALYGEEEGRE